MYTSLARMLALLVTMGPLVAQREAGGFHQSFTLEGGNYFLFHISSTPSQPNYILEWVGDNTFYVQTTMPFDIPGDSRYFGDGRFVVSGRDSGTGNNYLLRLELTLNPPNVHIKETYDTGTFDAAYLAFNSTDSRLYLHDVLEKEVRAAVWIPWSPLPATWSGPDLSTLQSMPTKITEPEAGESPLGAYLRYPDAHFPYDPNHETLVYLDRGGNWTWLETFSRPLGSQPTGWMIRDAVRQSVYGPMFLMGGSGTIEVREVDTGTLAMTGTVFPASDWVEVQVPPGALVAGTKYKVTGGGFTDSAQFIPSYRFGAPTGQGNYQAGHGVFISSDLRVGNLDFAPSSEVFWTDDESEPPDEVLDSYLAVALETPSESSVVTLPTGETVLANPLAILGPDPDDTGLDPGLWFRLMRYTVGIPSDPNLEGQGVLFQFAAVTPDQLLMVSDVFGGDIKGAGGAAAASAPSGSGSDKARLTAAREWLRSIDTARAPRMRLWASMVAALMSKTKFIGGR